MRGFLGGKAVLLLLLVASIASTGDDPTPPAPKPVRSGPVAVIKGNKTADTGELVVLDGSDSENAGGYRWLSIDPGKANFIEVNDSGSKIALSSGKKPGVRRFVLIVANADANGKIRFDNAFWNVTVNDGGPTPPDPVNPDPPTPPDPVNPDPPAPDVVPEGSMGLIRLSYLSAKALPPAARSAVPAVAAAHRQAAAAAPGLSDAATILNIRREAVRKAVPENARSGWITFDGTLYNALEKLDTGPTDRLKQGSDWAQAFNEIADGLERFAKEQKK